MRICIIGKFPPIQGGVSTRTYWIAHGLAASGHEVHVVTNAKEARPPFRVYMRPQDWERCEGVYGRGSVTVHWSDAVDSSQAYIPMASPFVSKLAGLAARAHSEFPFDVVYSHYLEPYGVAGHLAAQIAGVPHVVRMAGSDAGRLWPHPQFELLYDHLLRAAEIVIAAGPTAERARRCGVAADRIAFAGGFPLSEDLFAPDAPVLDLAELRSEIESEPEFRGLQWGELAGDRPCFGIYGKLGESKGSSALLAALHRLKQDGLRVGLVALAHGASDVEREFRAVASSYGLADRIHQIPFLPHWRVPGFLRACQAVCCLEQGFPITFHTPLVPREVLLCGTCLIGSTELIQKLPDQARMAHGYNCVAVEDVNDTARLSQQLAAILQDPVPAAAVGRRGREAAQSMQRGLQMVPTLERIFEAAVARQRVPEAIRWSSDAGGTEAARDRFPVTRAARLALDARQSAVRASAEPASEIDLAQACVVLVAVERAAAETGDELQALVPAVRVEIAIATASAEADEASPSRGIDGLFRLRVRRWAMADADLAMLVPVRHPLLRIVEFDYDVADVMAARAAFPPARGRSYIAVFGRSKNKRAEPLLIDGLTAQILELSDGRRTAAEIARLLDPQGSMSSIKEKLDWIEHLFVQGLLWLQDTRLQDDAVRASVLRKICGFASIVD